MKIILLVGENSAGRFALVDDEDFEKLNSRRWNFDPTSGYAVGRSLVRERPALPKHFKMHSLLLPPLPGFEVDHINRVKLDNRRTNLRYVTKGQNTRNCLRKDCKTGYRGVFLIAPGKENPYQAKIRHNGRYYHLGCFPTAEAAATAYALAADDLSCLPPPKLRKWTAEEFALLKRYKELGPAKIAEMLHRNLAAVRTQFCKLNARNRSM